MARKILAVIAVLWGAVVLLGFLPGRARVGGGAYGAGRVTGLLFGVLLIAAGLYALFGARGRRPRG